MMGTHSQLKDLKELWRSELRRIEQLADIRPKRLEVRLKHMDDAYRALEVADAGQTERLALIEESLKRIESKLLGGSAQ
jgi:hypothetical protein